MFSIYIPYLDGLDESGAVPGDVLPGEGGLELLLFPPVLDSVPPGELAPPVAEPGVIPK